MMTYLDKFPLKVLIPVALLLGLAPFYPEPHLYEKLQMLIHGTLTRPIDIFDLLMHGSPALLLILKVIRSASEKQG